MDQLPKSEANHTPLSPMTFLQRAAAVYADRTSVVYGRTRFTWSQTYDRCRRLAAALRSLNVYGRTRFTWSQTYDRCRRLAAALRSLNVAKNHVVSVLAPNVPALYEMHFAVPMAGAVLNAINARLDAGSVAAILKHSEAKVFFVDYQYVRLAGDALKALIRDASEPHALPLVVVIDDADAPTGIRLGELEYEELLASGDPARPPHRLEDEWDPIALNYTSGTTSSPKGVVYSHRGAYLSTVSLLLQWEVGSEPVYLWSLPMFHCNGWTFTWGMAARGGTNVCIRTTSAAEMHGAIAAHGVTHMCCAPTVFNILLEDAPADCLPLAAPVHVLTGGAPPPAALLERVEAMGFHVTHAYGLTEATGPALVCEWRAEWSRRPAEDRAALKARQGVGLLSLADADVRDPGTSARVPRDGRALGEIVLRGSSVMKGYYKDGEGTAAALRDGWFWTGDVGVVHPDGYVEIKDRSKDVIISGGENISSVEVEAVLYRQPAVAEAAVVAMPHRHWGETPCAFVALKKGWREAVGEEQIIAHCRGRMAGFMVPKRVVFMAELPKTSTGKIKKFELREAARRLAAPEKKRNPQGGAGAPQGTAVHVPYPNGNNGHREPQEQVLAVSRL